jgi:signal transduction histidine kinase
MTTPFENSKNIYFIIQIFRYLHAFCTRGIIIFLGLLISFRIVDSFIGEKTEQFSSLLTVIFFIACTLVTLFWSYYIVQTRIPLIWKKIRKQEKKNLISSNVMLIVIYNFLLKNINEGFNESSYLFMSISKIYVTVSLYLFIGTLIIVCFKKTTLR